MLHKRCRAHTLARVHTNHARARAGLCNPAVPTPLDDRTLCEQAPDLPLRVAVRMSMGVPGLMEPFRYGRHVNCDGGMCNDFPMNALPDDGGRLGLMVRPKAW